MKKNCETLRILSAKLCEKVFLQLSTEELYHKVASLRQGDTRLRYSFSEGAKLTKKNFAQIVLSATLVLTMFSAGAQTTDNIQQLIDQGNEIYYSNPDSSFALICEAENLAKKKSDNSYFGRIALAKARYFVLVTDYRASSRELTLAIYFFENNRDFVNLSKAYSLRSILLDRIGEKEESTKVLREAYLISKNNNDREGEIARLTNLSLNFIEENQADSAYKYLLLLESLRADIKNESQYFLEQNLGMYYAMIGDLKKAIYYYQRAKSVSEKFNMQDSRATILARLAGAYRQLNMLKEAEEFGVDSYMISVESALIFEEREAINELILLFEAKGDFKMAFDFRGKLIDVDDRINKLEKIQKLKEDEYQLTLKDKENQLAQKELHIQAEKLETAEAKSQSIILVAVIFVVIIILVFIVMIYLRTRKLNKTIELSRVILEQKNREVGDSITYAKQIQDAILPPRKYYENLFKEIFVFYRPKGIVAGDFYWFESRNNRVYFVAADCTGHGVPGAMVSVICHNALNRSINEFGLFDPAEILEKTSELVLETFIKSDREVKDGMDIAFCAVDTQKKVLHFCGANNPVWVIKSLDTKTISSIPEKQIIVSDTKLLVELRGEKRPIGFTHQRKSFATQQLQLEDGDTIYLSTDGYLDQFGGDRGKKLKSKFFKQKLLQIQNYTLIEQHEMIISIFDNWKGELEQVDDVCVLAVRI